jgi:hypothetical protein
MVDVVPDVEAAVRLDEVADDGGDVLLGDGALELGQLDAHAVGYGAQLLVELVATDAPEVVTTEVEEEALDQLLGVVAGRRVTGAQLLVDLDEGLAAGGRGVAAQP